MTDRPVIKATCSDDPMQSDRASILAFAVDIPNIITLAGLCCGVLGILLAIQGNFPAAIIAMLWAVLFDWYDGPVARRIAGRSDNLKAFGGKLDSLVDIVSLAICPAIILLSYGDFNPWFLPGALAIIMAGVLRLAYFDVFGVDADGTRLSWSKKGRDGMRAATKGERFNALRQHEDWATEKGLQLFNPRGSEYDQLTKEQEQ